MLPLTKDKPKHLIKVNGRPFLSYLLDNIFSAGYKDIIVVGGYMGQQVADFVKNYVAPKQKESNIQFINQYDYLNPQEKNGTACPLMCVKDLISKDNFLYIGGDNFYSARDLKAIGIDDNFNYVSGIVSENPEKFGVLKIEKEFLQEIVEKPKNFVGNLINASLYKFTPEIFDKVFKIEKSPRGEYEVTDAVNMLAENKKVRVNKLKDKEYWIDFGAPEDIEKFENFLKNEGNK
jgi:bifunctional UDP-N-acetylglucosamine pyrophosphorylase/glucosamine-1-phosphate N-acetyltransferase